MKGIAASSGIAIGKVFKYVNEPLIITNEKIEDIDDAIARLKNAMEKSEAELNEIKKRTVEKLDEAHGMIFDAHIEILKDPELFSQTIEKIKNDQLNPAASLKAVSDDFVALFEMMDDEYMKERATDIKDVTGRVLSHLLNVKVSNLSSISEPVILVSEDLTPSDTSQLDPEKILGFITTIGGRTSHSAIMARSMEIPAVLGASDILSSVNDGDLIIMDGHSGDIILNPTEDTLIKYREINLENERLKIEQGKLVNQRTVSACGHHVELAANIGSTKDLESVLKNGAEGIGLFRTEFLYMDAKDFPTEEVQYQAYKTVLEKMGEKPVVIRTLDIGGDKDLSYMQMSKELNPFLGHRAIRLCFEKVDLFKTQLRALLRASTYGNLKIMFPMIATIGDFRKAKAILDETKKAVIAEGFEVSETLEVGIMVEIPSVAILADRFAEEVDFFSIGTNDLIQYTFAADRMNEKVAYLYQPYNPSLLRLIKLVIDSAHKEGKWVGMCGEMAGDEKAIPLLLGMGLDEFSMSASNILPARALIKKLNIDDMNKLVDKALISSTNEDVIDLVEEVL